jgi:chromosome segregation ATPase
VNENIFSSKDFYGNKKEPMVLKKSDGQLSVGTGFGSIVLGLSEDKSVLRVGNMSYKRIDNDRLNIIKADIKKKEEEREQARIEREKKNNEKRIAREKARLKMEEDMKKCNQLISEINGKIKSINKYSSNNSKWTKEYNKIKNKYTEIAKTYENCRPHFY